ncbi:MAG: hypothetical protein JWL75_349 [Parcubacteria group bacterium]|nr:hypothetical protein [Parcubacteria group bacterium]
MRFPDRAFSIYINEYLDASYALLSFLVGRYHIPSPQQERLVMSDTENDLFGHPVSKQGEVEPPAESKPEPSPHPNLFDPMDNGRNEFDDSPWRSR